MFSYREEKGEIKLEGMRILIHKLKRRKKINKIRKYIKEDFYLIPSLFSLPLFLSLSLSLVPGVRSPEIVKILVSVR